MIAMLILALTAAVEPAGNLIRVGADGDHETIQAALDVAGPGDTVVVADGIYVEALKFPADGELDRPIVLRAENSRGARVVSDQWVTIDLSERSNIHVVGLEVVNNFTEEHSGTGIAVIDATNIEIRDNLTHGCGGNGIGIKGSDGVLVEGNDAYFNSQVSKYQTSGISVYKPVDRGGRTWEVDGVGYALVFRGNRSWGNWHTVRTDAGKLTDGNGIIIDNTKSVDQTDFMADLAAGPDAKVYGRPILVEHNACWDNGGAGISAYESTDVMIRNNSTANNARIEATRQSEITIGNSPRVVVKDNASLGRVGTHDLANRGAGGEIPVVKQYGSTDVTWEGNLLYGGPFQDVVATSAGRPRFVDERAGDLRLTDPAHAGKGADPALFERPLPIHVARKEDQPWQVGETLVEGPFEDGLPRWKVELEEGGDVTAEDGKLRIDVPRGATVWFAEPFEGPLRITYTATAIDAGGPNDRPSNLNCFWMAGDARGPLMEVERSGQFSDYNALECYYAGLGGWQNTTSRFRRYIGDPEDRPLLDRHDLRARRFLVQPNVPTKIELIAFGDLVQYWRDDVLLFELRDDEPYTEGYFGFRTVDSHTVIEDFRVQRLTQR